MDLIKTNWTEKDVRDLKTYLKSIGNPEKEKWTRRVINTQMPMYVIKMPPLRQIANEIAKGDMESYLKLFPNESYEECVILGFLIPKIKDFKTLKTTLIKYGQLVDNWSNCDQLKFRIDNNNALKFFEMATEFLESKYTYVRRIGVIILFDFVKFDEYVERVFENIMTLKNDQEYYVNMAVAWLVAEMFIKRREETLEFLKTDPLNAFAVNKAVQKCRDSFRVSASDKEMLLQFKK